MIVGRFTGSRLVRRYEPMLMLRFTFPLSGIGILAHWLGPILALSLTGPFLAGIGMANLYPLTTSLGLQAVKHNSSAGSSRLSLASGLSMLVSPLIFGVITDVANIRVAFTAEPAFLLIAVAAVLYGARLMRLPKVGSAEAFAT